MGTEEVARLLEAGRFREISPTDLDDFVDRMVVIADESESAANRADAMRLIQLAADAVRARGLAAPSVTSRISGEARMPTAGQIAVGALVVGGLGLVVYIVLKRR